MKEQQQISRLWPLALGLAAVLMLLPQLKLPPLSGNEAQAGLVARGIVEAGESWLQCAVAGERVEVPFLLVWSAALASLPFGEVNEFTLRLPSVLSLFFAVFAATMMARRYGGNVCGLISGACVLSSIGAVQWAARADGQVMAAALLGAAWLLWFELSRSGSRWLYAWVGGLGLSCLAASISGLHCVAFFYLPLIFVRRPTDVRKRLLQLPHLVALALVALASLLLQWRLSGGGAQSFTLLPPLFPDVNSELGPYLAHLLSFPFKVALYLMPWTLLAWPAFCESFRTLERHPLLFTWLRTACLAPFLATWLIPDAKAETLLPLLIPLSVMAGLHYPMLMRRHEATLRKCFLFILLGVLLVAGALAALHLSQILDWRHPAFTFSRERSRVILPMSLVAAALSLYLLASRHQASAASPFRLLALLIALHLSIPGLRLLLRPAVLSQEEFAAELATRIPKEGAVVNAVFKDSGKPLNLWGELFHLQRQVLPGRGQLQQELLPKEIYAIGRSSPPLTQRLRDPSWFTWELVESLPAYNGISDLKLWRGIHKSPSP
ncbi:MAG: hypothetical protein RL095_2254 [Verrucomicrobiota bacterium]|jgi:4-amino-4-deoxy-L-arabinose transferase-like glycosyltransferase